MMEKDRDKAKEPQRETAALAGEPEREVTVEESEEAKLLSKLTQEHEQTVKERDDYLDLLQRSRAEFDNFRRRNNNAREDAYASGVTDTIEKFLPVLDNLDRAAESQGGEAALREGLQLVLKQFNALLIKAGVEEIKAEGEVFDPNLHHAVMQEAAEGFESGTVCQVLQRGYKMGDKVLRHCLVKVAE
jgi:molecular chaperone GrpE